MTTKHLDKYGKAVDKIKRSGLAVTFTKSNYTHDPLTEETEANADTTVSGYAVEIPGDDTEYEALKLTKHEALTLMFVPSAVGEEPELLSVVDWSGRLKKAYRIQPLRPDGVLIAAKVIVA